MQYSSLVLYSRTKGVKQKYLLHIYLIGSVYTILTIATFNAQLHNWLISDETIPLTYSTPSSSGWLTIGESAPPPPRVLDELLAPPFFDLWDPQFLWLTRRSLQSQLTLLEPEYCPTSLPVRIAQGSVSGQLAPVLIWNTQVLYQTSGPYRMKVRIARGSVSVHLITQSYYKKAKSKLNTVE